MTKSIDSKKIKRISVTKIIKTTRGFIKPFAFYHFHNIINELGFQPSTKFVDVHSCTINEPEY